MESCRIHPTLQTWHQVITNCAKISKKHLRGHRFEDDNELIAAIAWFEYQIAPSIDMASVTGRKYGTSVLTQTSTALKNVVHINI